MNDFFLKENTDFTPFTLQHVAVVVFIFIFGVALIRWARKQPERTQIRTGNALAIFISLTVITEILAKIYVGDFDFQEHLPLHLCNFFGLLIPILSFKRKFLHYELIFFLVLTGTFQGTVTPVSFDYMNIYFIRYWSVHGGLVVFMLYATFIYKMRPTLKSVWKSFFGMQIYMVLMFTINFFLGSNYFYTNRKPDAASMLDLFGDWPYYVLVVEIIVIPYFLLMYLPFYLTRNKVKS